jgi:hypothetical protein
MSVRSIRAFPQFAVTAGFFFPTNIIPTKFWLHDNADTWKQVDSAFRRKQTESNAAEKEIVEMDNTLGARSLL